MNIVRWLMDRPIIAAWFLAIIAVLLALFGSGEKTAETEVNNAAESAVVAAGNIETDEATSLQNGQSKTVENQGKTETAQSEVRVPNTVVDSGRQAAANLVEKTQDAAQSLGHSGKAAVAAGTAAVASGVAIAKDKLSSDIAKVEASGEKENDVIDALALTQKLTEEAKGSKSIDTANNNDVKAAGETAVNTADTSLGEKTAEAKETITDAGNSVAESVTSTVSGVKSAVTDAGETVVDAGKQIVSRTGEVMSNATDTVGQMLSGQKDTGSGQEQTVSTENLQVPQAPVKPDQPDGPQLAAGQKSGENASASTVVANKQAGMIEASAEEKLLMAREAYWNNGLDEAATIYRELIQQHPERIDFKGELGNVFWRQGYPKKAAAIYAEIAMPMLEQGQGDRVANMIGFIGLFYPEKAAAISQRIEQQAQQ